MQSVSHEFRKIGLGPYDEHFYSSMKSDILCSILACEWCFFLKVIGMICGSAVHFHFGSLKCSGSHCLVISLSSSFWFCFSKPMEPDRLFDCLPNSLRPTPAEHSGDIGKINAGASNAENQSKSLENGIYKPPTLIPPRIVPLLHDLAQQMAQAGRHQQCLKIYGYISIQSLALFRTFEIGS